ncbi:MetQ/NlpA family ABC transporter substrate-binding protein [Clostridium botulinum D/C]|uniref:MetQ/NlpA family ABC transporter substrate-binding protein n=1 Tax=Clostridium botulinum TaxID=1491 RepID=UPI001E4449E4|nr:MetQ/NlpA family ABC transporter substrate-binding protein [Clostridium botulinum]MCD3351424.1 MetQ/NlpA family ABC transporter substrate-binding protein [Clostridium botulinum D/C]MCD3360380.1 MetQ/NlpA family ABC transporter substrate-binding protein [Clostridium botulinum D/C]MCD3362794.1 MetQ/NlpA family ABC transporter substrate-binding protein [Clostridium botulinum D/C]MCD3366185.1 MetQ/NlpA family ABC transporter substrate-binding protein [Clostridium botulinum D/C]
MKKRILSAIVLSTLILGVVGLTGCGNKKSSNESKANKTTIIVGASPEPHKEILEKVKQILEKKGYKLEIKVFTDYVIPNTALEEGEIDANFYQHIPYLEQFNKEKGTHLTHIAKVHLEPMGIYSKKVKSVNEIKEGATIAVPNDPTNESRALRLLEKQGIIKFKEGQIITKLDIKENPKNIKIQELEAAQLPRTLTDVDAALINTNYALPAGLNPLKNALAIEDKDSPYANVIAVKEDNKDKEYIKELKEAVNSPEVKKFIEDNYRGSIIPSF